MTTNKPDKQPLPKDQGEQEPEETFLSDFGKLSQSLSKEQREAALREVGQMQKEGLIKVSDPKPVQWKAPKGGLKRLSPGELSKCQTLWQKMPPK